MVSPKIIFVLQTYMHDGICVEILTKSVC